jgi:hypothetical protein
MNLKLGKQRALTLQSPPHLLSDNSERADDKQIWINDVRCGDLLEQGDN